MSYLDIEIPPDKDPQEYSYTERRAEIFQMIVEAGHPDLISRTELSNYYGTAISTISNDVKVITEELSEELSDDAAFITETFYRKAIREKVDNGQYMKADKLLRSYNEWLFETGRETRAADRSEETVDITKQWTSHLQEQDPDEVLDVEDEQSTEAGSEAQTPE